MTYPTNPPNLIDTEPPHNIDIEQALLASLMSIDESFESVSTIITADDFYGERHRLLFGVISHLSKIQQPYDMLMVYDSLMQQGLLNKVGGEEYLSQITQSPATMFNLVPYAERIKELSIHRKLIKTANMMLELAYRPKQQSVSDILDKVESEIYQINEQYSHNTQQGVMKINDILNNVVNQIKEFKERGGGMLGLETPFEELNNKTQGLQKGDLIIVAARPSMGKTAFAMNIAEKALHNNLPVLIFSMEMPAEAIVMRMASAFGQINQTNIRTGNMKEDEWARFMTAVGFFQSTHLYIDARNNLPPNEVRATCRRIAKNHDGGLGLIVVDYLQLMKIPGMENNRVNEIGEVSRSLKALAREMNCPVIALSQLNRGLEQRTDKRPLMSDLRESGAIEQDADLILFIYREEYYQKDEKKRQEVAGQAEILIGKNRNGPIGKIPLRFIGEFTKFDNPEFPMPNYDEE